VVAELTAGMLPEAIARLRAHIWSVSEHLGQQPRDAWTHETELRPWMESW
jgi:hypothetical protein